MNKRALHDPQSLIPHTHTNHCHVYLFISLKATCQTTVPQSQPLQIVFPPQSTPPPRCLHKCIILSKFPLIPLLLPHSLKFSITKAACLLIFTALSQSLCNRGTITQTFGVLLHRIVQAASRVVLKLHKLHQP